MAKRTKKQAESEKQAEQPVEKLPALSGDQQRAAAFLARVGYVRGSRRKSGALKQCAAAIGVHENTILNWLKLPVFQAQLEGYADRLIDAAFAGLETLLRGDVIADIAPNPTAIIWFLKCQKPELFDDQLKRDNKRRKHEKEMLETKLAAGLPPEDERELPGWNLRVTGQGERIDPKDRDGDDELH